MHGQYDARATVTFPAAGYHCPLTSTKLYLFGDRGMSVNNLHKVVTWWLGGLAARAFDLRLNGREFNSHIGR